jgi:hypothetical protein
VSYLVHDAAWHVGEGVLCLLAAQCLVHTGDATDVVQLLDKGGSRNPAVD